VRRALHDELPAFSHFFRLHPWDVERLTMGELRTYRDQLHKLLEATDGT